MFTESPLDTSLIRAMLSLSSGPAGPAGPGGPAGPAASTSPISHTHTATVTDRDPGLLPKIPLMRHKA